MYMRAVFNFHTLIKITKEIEMLLICAEDVKYEIGGGYVLGFYT